MNELNWGAFHYFTSIFDQEQRLMCIYYLTRRIKCLFHGTTKQILLAEVQLAKSPSLLQVSLSGFMTKASLISSYKRLLTKTDAIDDKL